MTVNSDLKRVTLQSEVIKPSVNPRQFREFFFVVYDGLARPIRHTPTQKNLLTLFYNCIYIFTVQIVPKIGTRKNFAIRIQNLVHCT